VHRTPVLVSTVLTCTAVVGLAACGAATSPATTAAVTAPAPAALHLGVDGSRFTGVPSTPVAPGQVSLTFANTGTAPHMAAIGRLAAGHFAADLPGALAAAQGLPPWLTLVGGVDDVAAGHTAGWTGTLDAGSYVLLSLSSGAEGRPDVADGMLAPFTVAGQRAVAAPGPATGATVTLGPGGTLAMTPVAAGSTALRLVDTDGVPRTVDVTAVAPGRTWDDVQQEAQRGTGVPPSLVPLGGTVVPAHGEAVVGIEPAAAGTTYVVFDLDHVPDGAIAHETAR
jgi:hypothetical protein